MYGSWEELRTLCRDLFHVLFRENFVFKNVPLYSLFIILNDNISNYSNN